MLPSPLDQIRVLQESYSATSLPARNIRHALEEYTAKSGVFLGAREITWITGRTIDLRGGVCVAAPTVNLLAVETLKLGVGDGSDPFQFFASSQLSIGADEVYIGKVLLHRAPPSVTLSCNRVTFLSPSGIPHPLVDVVKRWATNPEMEIEQVDE